MHIILARLDWKQSAIVFVDGKAQMVKMHEWLRFCEEHRGATLFGCDLALDMEPEDIEPEDSFDSKEAVDWVNARLRAGNEWAWFYAIVTAKRGDWTATDTLGACSYEDEAHFVTADGYFADMAFNAASEVQARFVAAFGTFETI